MPAEPAPVAAPAAPPVQEVSAASEQATSLVDPLIDQGLLLRPVPQSVTTDQPIYIVASRRGKLRAEALYLRDWLVAEATLVASARQYMPTTQ